MSTERDVANAGEFGFARSADWRKEADRIRARCAPSAR
jgi:hypothetical protein